MAEELKKKWGNKLRYIQSDGGETKVPKLKGQFHEMDQADFDMMHNSRPGFWCLVFTFF